MRLELAVIIVSAVFVSNVMGQDINLMLRLMGMDPIPLPPSPPKSLFPQLYQPSSRTQVQRPAPMTPQQLQQLLAQKRKEEQEQQILYRLQSLSPQQIKQLQENLTPDQLKQLVARIQYLKQQQQERTTQTKAAQTYAPSNQNTIISMANRIRQVKDPNALHQAPVSVGTTRIPTSPSRSQSTPSDPFREMQQLNSYSKKSRDARTAGCMYPMGMGAMETALMFRSCTNPSARAACMGTGGQCVEVGMSIMCCPFGYNSQMIDAVNYMRRMEQFVAQMS